MFLHKIYYARGVLCVNYKIKHSLQFLRNLIGQFHGLKSLRSPLLIKPLLSAGF